MRQKASPEIIRGVLNTLEALWMKYPEQRLGQLLINLACDRDLWNMDEQAIYERMREILDKGWAPQHDPKTCTTCDYRSCK